MKILLSAYACEPAKGSEPGVGWHWAVEMAREGHEIHVLTRTNNIAQIKARQTDLAGLKLYFYGYDLPRWARWWKRGQRGIRLYYLLWQWGAYRWVRHLKTEVGFDFVQHITFGVYRHPSFMGGLDIPFIFGPVGGGESTPPRLVDGLPRRGRWVERLREGANRLARYDPLLQYTYRKAALIFCKTPETWGEIPVRFRHKCVCAAEIGTDRGRLVRTHVKAPSSPRYLYVGRLLYWKGTHLVLSAMAELAGVLPDARLTIVGEGKEGPWLKRIARQLGIEERVQWLGQLSQDELFPLYRSHTAFVFPSLHDSSGNVIMEAMSQGLPVICLDIGGPGAVLPRECGIKISVRNQTSKELISEIARAMSQLAHDQPLRDQLAASAIAAAAQNTWNAVIKSALGEIERVLTRRTVPEAV